MILEDPTENGVYTLSMTINREGTSEESMQADLLIQRLKLPFRMERHG